MVIGYCVRVCVLGITAIAKISHLTKKRLQKYLLHAWLVTVFVYMKDVCQLVAEEV